MHEHAHLLIKFPAFQIRTSKRGDGYTKVSKRDGYEVRPLNVCERARQ